VRGSNLLRIGLVLDGNSGVRKLNGGNVDDIIPEQGIAD
jgi:hypothetical protein